MGQKLYTNPALYRHVSSVLQDVSDKRPMQKLGVWQKHSRKKKQRKKMSNKEKLYDR